VFEDKGGDKVMYVIGQELKPIEIRGMTIQALDFKKYVRNGLPEDTFKLKLHAFVVDCTIEDVASIFGDSIVDSVGQYYSDLAA
jgi:hypothetical protein